MTQPSLRERLRYAFDNFMARGTVALVIGLFVVSLTIVLAIALVGTITGAGADQDLGFPSLLWRSLLRTLDPGTMGGDEGSPLFLALMLAVTVGGIFVIASLIGILSSGLEAKLSELRKGRSRVLEHDHTVVLGWSQEIYAVLEQLFEANRNKHGDVIVILADRDKVEMEDDIRERMDVPRNVRIVCRHGRPTDPDQIDIANVQTSRTIIVLSPESADADADVLKTLLAIINDPNRRPEPYHVVAVLRSSRNANVARMVGKDEVELVVVDDIIARLTAQACRQSGLSIVYMELLDFAGDEIYFSSEPSLVGKTFGATLAAYDDSAVIGLHDGTTKLNPPMDTPIDESSQVIVITEDDDTAKTSGDVPDVDDRLIVTPDGRDRAPEHTLILGWNRHAATIITELDKYVAPGSRVTVVARAARNEPGDALRNSTLTHQSGDPTDRELLDTLNVASFHHVIVLSEDDHDADTADSRTLITLLHLRDIASRDGASFSITSEILDSRNRDLAEVAKADDFIVSDRLVSLLIAQIAENKRLGYLFDHLFEARGSEIHMKPASDYVRTRQPVSFHVVVEAARRRNEVAIGYRIRASEGDAERNYGIVVNPRKRDEISFTDGDRVIVLADY